MNNIVINSFVGKIMIFSLFILSLFSCINKDADKNIVSENILENNYSQEFSYESNIKVEMIHPIEYYKNEIIKYEEDYYGFTDTSMEITQLMNISSIEKADNIIPEVLTFLVCWLNQKGYVYWLYSFNNEQKIIIAENLFHSIIIKY